MESAARAMLRRLGAGVRPGGAAVRTPGAPVDGARFDELIALARRGMIESGQRLDLAPGVGPVDAGTMELLSTVADAANAAGFVRVGALIDGAPEEEGGEAPVRWAAIDVGGRRIESMEHESAGRFLTGVDAVVRVPGVEAHALREMLSEDAGRARRGRAGASLLGARPIENVSLIEALGIRH